MIVADLSLIDRSTCYCASFGCAFGESHSQNARLRYARMDESFCRMQPPVP